MAETTKREILQQAAQRVSAAELALWLDVPMRLLESWILGVVPMPNRKLVLVLDLLDKLGVSGVRLASNVRQLRTPLAGP